MSLNKRLKVIDFQEVFTRYALSLAARALVVGSALRHGLMPAVLAMICLSSFLAQAETAVRNREWRVLVDNSQARLKFEDGVFSIAPLDVTLGTPWAFAGTLQGLEPNSAGFYVGDLDGSGNSSVAFFEANQRVWYHGAIVGGRINFSVIAGNVFQIGSGPTLYPIDDFVTNNDQNQQAVSNTFKAQASASSSLPFPVEAEQHTKLATSRSMDTTITLYGDGGMYAVTTVSNGVWLTGFHGQATVTLFDGNMRKVTAFSSPQIGVTGTAFGKPVVTVGWQSNLTGDALASVRYASIVQQWDPDFNTIPRDSAAWVKLVLEFLQALVPKK